MKTLEMPLINCEINLILTWSANCVIKYNVVDQGTTLQINDTKLYFSKINLSTEDNVKLLQ